MGNSLIIRDAVKEQMRMAAFLADDRPFAHEHWHSDEAKTAWETRKPTLGGITLPCRNADWFALGYDAALAAMKETA